MRAPRSELARGVQFTAFSRVQRNSKKSKRNDEMTFLGEMMILLARQYCSDTNRNSACNLAASTTAPAQYRRTEHDMSKILALSSNGDANMSPLNTPSDQLPPEIHTVLAIIDAILKENDWCDYVSTYQTLQRFARVQISGVQPYICIMVV